MSVCCCDRSCALCDQCYWCHWSLKNITLSTVFCLRLCSLNKACVVQLVFSTWTQVQLVWFSQRHMWLFTCKQWLLCRAETQTFCLVQNLKNTIVSFVSCYILIIYILISLWPHAMWCAQVIFEVFLLLHVLLWCVWILGKCGSGGHWSLSVNDYVHFPLFYILFSFFVLIITFYLLIAINYLLLSIPLCGNPIFHLNTQWFNSLIDVM